MGAYTDPKIYAADPTAFQKGFMSTFGQFIEEQKKVEQRNEKALNEFNAGFFNSDQYQKADDAMRDQLSIYFKDQQEKFINAKSSSEKQKIASDTIAKARGFQNKFQITLEARGNAFASDYKGRPIEDFMNTDSSVVPMPKYLGDGKFGMTYGNKTLSEEQMYQNVPEKINETTQAAMSFLKNQKDEFNEDNKGRSKKELELLREQKADIIFKQLTNNQKSSIINLNELKSDDELKEFIRVQLGGKAFAYRAEQDVKAEQKIKEIEAKSKSEIQKIEAKSKADLEKERLKSEGKVDKYAKYASENKIDKNSWNTVIENNDRRALSNLENILIPFGLTATKEIASETGESVVKYRLKRSKGSAGQGILISKSDSIEEVNAKIREYLGAEVDEFEQYLVNQ